MMERRLFGRHGRPDAEGDAKGGTQDRLGAWAQGDDREGEVSGVGGYIGRSAISMESLPHGRPILELEP